MMGLVQPIMAVPHLTPTFNATPTNLAPPPANDKPEQLEYSLYIDSKESERKKKNPDKIIEKAHSGIYVNMVIQLFILFSL